MRAAGRRHTVEFDAMVRIDTPGEADYYRHGGIMQYVLRSLLELRRPRARARVHVVLRRERPGVIGVGLRNGPSECGANRPVSRR